MTITSLASTTEVREGGIAQSQATSATGSGSLDYDAFLKLLIAQMQNQDPLEPMKSSDYVAQIATFSQVEQSVETNSRLAELLTSSRIATAESLIGKVVTSPDGGTTGEVVSARIVDGAVIATLASGEEVRIAPGVTVGAAST